jgi:hypothetical protein
MEATSSSEMLIKISHIPEGGNLHAYFTLCQTQGFIPICNATVYDSEPG